MKKLRPIAKIHLRLQAGDPVGRAQHVISKILRSCFQRSTSRFVYALRYWRCPSICYLTTIVLLLGGVLPVHAKPDTRLLKNQKIKVSATPFFLNRKDKSRRQFGKLIWLGGISLSAKSAYLDGYSGLVIDRSGTKIIGISDSGSWLSADLTLGPDSSIAGLENVQIGPTPGAEGLTLANGDIRRGILYNSFEINNRIAKYPIRDGRIGPQMGLLSLPKSATKRRRNKGLEALARLRSGPTKGSLVVFAERFKEPEDFLNGWLLSKRGTRRLRTAPTRSFDITEVAPLPDGNILILERRFRYSEGIKMQIRRLYPEDLINKNRLDGEVLFEADDDYNIDNMEGITTHLNDNNEIVISLISDDNFNLFQRTLLMQFKSQNSTSR